MAKDSPRSVRTRDFKKQFDALPARIQKTAIDRYKNYFARDPSHELLERHYLYDVKDARPNSVAVTIAYGYRAVAFVDGDTHVWYWCGSHADYDKRFRPGR